MDQEVKYISIKDLVLWTENPRDPIKGNVKDQDIVDRALDDGLNKWTLSKLAKEMGPYYDFSELPTVVYHGNNPVVYDGNRRIILGKIKHSLVKITGKKMPDIPDFPEEIPCNVCSKNIALNNVYRKHSDTGSWQPLERDMFLYKFMNKPKSIFLKFEEETGIISSNPHMNQRFVKDEIFREDILESMGFKFKNGKLQSVHSDSEGYLILSDISDKIDKKIITTRKNRGKVKEVLEPSNQNIIDKNIDKKEKPSNISFKDSEKIIKRKSQSPRTRKSKTDIFGGKLYLRVGNVSNLYRDIADLHQFYETNKSHLSQLFPSIIRMSLRLLCETASKEKNMNFDNYLIKYFDDSKKLLSKNLKTTLSNQNVTKESIVQLLHTGAHSYESSANIEQTMALSFIVGGIITITHGKDN